MKRLLAFTAFLFFVSNTFSQLTLDAEIRPRFEFRHGFSTLFPDGEDPAAFVSQRTRLNTRYRMEQLDFYISVQDIRVWGDVRQLNTQDSNGFGVHQAWGEIYFNPEISLRLGRQLMSYDDERILGGVGWAQQARSHDMAMVRYNGDLWKVHGGIAFNQDGENVVGNVLTVENTYKSLQFIWAHRDWNNLSASFLFLNNGLQFIDEVDPDITDTRFSQTLGTHMLYSKERWNALGRFYYTFGKDVNNNDLSGLFVGLEGSYQFTPVVQGIIGTEYISGNDGGAPSDGKNKAFNPFYGTNHKFNGLMDYFYVGNHVNNVGLWDMYLGATFKTGEKSSLYARFHNFQSTADITGTSSRQMASEIDLVFKMDIIKYVGLQGGYSHLFQSDGIEFVKNNFDGNANFWIWAMITIKPVLFTTANKDVP